MQLAHTIDSLCDVTLALIYPQACGVCGASVERRRDWPACAACWRKTHIYPKDNACCWKCGREAVAAVQAEVRDQVRCHRCDGEAFTAARAIGKYEGALRHHVLRLKSEPHVGARLADLLFERFSQAPLYTTTRIIPVPLHPQRERMRGFNQAAVLGRSLTRRARLTLDEWSLIRVTHTDRYRAGMDAQARRETVLEAFHVQRPRLVEGERILLVDDVFTTGATVSMCAQALRAAGAEDVFVLTVARADSLSA